MQREKLLADVRVKMSVKHNDEKTEQSMRGAKTSEGDEDGRRLKEGAGEVWG